MKLRIKLEGKSYEVEVEVIGEEQAPHVSPTPVPHAIKPPPPPYGRGRNVPRSDEKTCRSPIAGVVASIAVAPGQHVEKGGALLVLEAMKMETKIPSLGAGIIKSVLVAPGDAVKPGQTLIELE